MEEQKIFSWPDLREKYFKFKKELDEIMGLIKTGQIKIDNYCDTCKYENNNKDEKPCDCCLYIIPYEDNVRPVNIKWEPK